MRQKRMNSLCLEENQYSKLKMSSTLKSIKVGVRELIFRKYQTLLKIKKR